MSDQDVDSSASSAALPCCLYPLSSPVVPLTSQHVQVQLQNEQSAVFKQANINCSVNESRKEAATSHATRNKLHLGDGTFDTDIRSGNDKKEDSLKSLTDSSEYEPYCSTNPNLIEFYKEDIVFQRDTSGIDDTKTIQTGESKCKKLNDCFVVKRPNILILSDKIQNTKEVEGVETNKPREVDDTDIAKTIEATPQNEFSLTYQTAERINDFDSNARTAVLSEYLREFLIDEIFECKSKEKLCILPAEAHNLFKKVNTNFSEGCQFRETEQSRKEYETDSCDDSVSSDGTLLNSEKTSDFEETSGAVSEQKANFDIMGNRGGKSGQQSDDDTPDDGKTHCCEIPKKKIKERTCRVSRQSRSDDLAFDTNEVYPFEGRTRSEQDLNEPVELEPFEIVETDYFKFVPGAGTSEIIKSASEAKFTPIAPIPEESVIIDYENKPSTSKLSEETVVKVPFYVDKGSRLPEAGTATAHSTFEFKQVKPKYRKLPDEQKHTYENVQMSPASAKNNGAKVREAKASISNSQSNSISSSKDVSRKNSTDIVQKPSRKGKSKPTDTSDVKSDFSDGTKTKTADLDETQVKSIEPVKPKVPQNEKEPFSDKVKDRGKTKPTQSNKEIKNGNSEYQNKTKIQSVRDSEIDRNIDSVLMLTQTMFSQAKTNKDSKTTIPNKEIDETVPVIQYENVNVCAKLEATGISIGHKGVPVASTKIAEKSQICSQFGRDSINSKPVSKMILSDTKPKPTTSTEYEVGNRDLNKVTEHKTKQATLKERKDARKELSYDIIEISDTGTLIIKSLEDLPSAKPCEDGNCEEEEYSDTEQFLHDEETIMKSFEQDQTENLISETSSSLEKESSEADENTSGKTVVKHHSLDKDEHVPPPSPLTMLILEEDEEEENDEEEPMVDENKADEDDRRKSEIIEFSENVCKRLSQLLENMPDDRSEPDEDDEDGREEPEAIHYYETCAYSNHIYETIDGSGRIVVSKQNQRTNEKEIYSESEMQTQDHCLNNQARSESSSTLKRTSGDSEAYQERYLRKCSQSSDDDLPEYFDPRDIPPPRVDIDTFNDNPNIDTTHDMTSKYNGKNVSVERYSANNKKEDKNVGLALKSFGPDLINEAPIASKTEDLQDMTPTADAHPNFTPLMELANVEEEATAVQFDTSGRQSVTCTESDLDTSEHRDDLSTDSMLADDEAEETMEILFTKTYTEPVEGAEVFLSCTVVNSAYKDQKKKSETWLSDEALEYLEANASEVMSTAFIKAKREMKDIQLCLQSLRKQMEHFHSDCDDVSLPDLPGPDDSFSPEYFGLSRRKAVTD